MLMSHIIKMNELWNFLFWKNHQSLKHYCGTRTNTTAVFFKQLKRKKQKQVAGHMQAAVDLLWADEGDENENSNGNSRSVRAIAAYKVLTALTNVTKLV